MVPRPGHGHVAEPAPGQELPHRPAGEQAQVTGHHAARPTEHSAQAHLGEDRLDADREQATVVPRGQVRRGQQQGATRPQHPADLRDRRVGVDQVLDQLAHDNHIGHGGPQRQTGRPDAGTHQREAEATAGALLELSLEAAAQWPSFARELADASGLECALREDGTLLLARDADSAAALERELAAMPQL